MFFKRIEMTGFKSFATKTVVDFQPGVTVVVGPNGCGKSNIFDAIRWVLGEQSAKSLRGQKMGDVIFQGSATYKPMGCSQVSLVIDNEGRRLPIDYSEVSITRRLYRSGESEYQINKSPCRLRDIQDLLLDTGAGMESYSVMEQGRVGDIIKSRPENRRELFEEAAGIAKYKTRKAEALRKLERTESDLIRLADRVSECRTRTVSLKRQASKAERYKGLQEAADAIEMNLLTLDLARVGAQTEKIEKEYSEAKDRLAVVRAENDKVQARQSELQLQVLAADERLRDLSIQKEDQRKYISEISHEITRLKSHAEGEVRRAEEDLRKQLDDVALRRDEFSRNLAEANAEEARLALRAIVLEAKQNIRRAEYERLRADSAATREKIADLRKTVEKKNEEAMRLRNERSRLEMQIEMSQKAAEDFAREKLEYEQAIQRLDSAIADVRESLDGRGGDLARLEKAFEEAREQALEAMRARDVLRDEHRKVERELGDARSGLGALERLAKDYAGYYGGVRAVMQASENHMLDGVIGVVPELIQSIEAEHDLAIEIALGSQLQSIVMRSAQDAKRAIEFLKTERMGRATFLPLDIIDAQEPGRAVEIVLGRSGVVGLASRLVAYDRYIERAVVHLLGRTVVTESTDVSLHLMRSGQRGRYVTLDGQLTSPGGAMTGGSRDKSQIVSRQREITELAERAHTLTETESDLARRIARREEAMVDLQARGEKLRTQIGELRLELGKAETQLATLRDSREQRKTSFEQLKARVESTETHREGHAEALETCQAALASVEEAIEAERQSMSVMENAVYGHNQEVDRVGEHVNHIDKEIMRLGEQRSHLRQRAEGFMAERESLDRSATALRLEQRRSREAAHNHHEQAARIEAERLELEREINGIADLCALAAQEKETAQQAIREEMTRSQRLTSEFNAATNRYNDLQAAHINAQADLRRLRERSMEHFNREIEDVAAQVGTVEADRLDLVEELDSLKDELRKMGENINMGALIEYKEESERLEFLTAQESDLMEARDSLRQTIETIDKTTSKLFWEAFEQIRENFILVYRRLFGGGKADLVLQKLEDGDPLLEGGVEIVAQPPGKKLQNITLLSGGEQALTAVSLMFAIFMYKPSPFCVMDEIDAPLDDANVLRFRDMLIEFSKGTQFIIITHNKITMNLADTIYGITMQETGVSSLVSVAFEQVDSLHAQSAS